VTIALLTLLLALDASPRTTPAPAAAPRVMTACMAVTRADVELVLGRKVSRGEEANTNGSSTCDYSGGNGQVTVTLQHLAAAPDMAQEKASLQAEFPNSRVRAATVEGADAFFLDLGEAGTLLHVIRGGHEYVLVAVLGFGAPDQVSAAALRLARTALRQ
jgi:hypothetical protein